MGTNCQELLHFHKHSLLKRYLIGIGLIVVVLFINVLVKYFFADDVVPMTLFLGPVVIAAWFGGRSLGIALTLTGALIENIIYANNLATTEPELVRTIVYFAQGFLISFIFGEVHHAQDTIALREKQLSESLKRERENLLEKEALIRKLNLTQEQILAERGKAEEANRLKSLFLAHMSHEIRTPLVSVLGFAELLKESDLTLVNAKKYGCIIERTGHNLLNIINDILDLSKVEADHLEIEKVPFSVNNLVAEVHSTLLISTQQKSILFEFVEESQVPALVVADPTRLRQILLNLIGNAIKFTEKGFVKIQYYSQENQLVFKITDSGIGIAPEHQIFLFESFRQANTSITRRYTGTGLGLSLSKKLAHKMGGDVQLLHSDVDQGSVFQLKIAFDDPALDQLQSDFKEELLPLPKKFNLQKNKTILLVDDSVDNQFLVQTILSKWGLRVELASNGKEAIEKVKKENYDLILMDMQMPIMDGYTACAQLTEESCQIPIIALTANAMKEDRDRCLQVGCKDYLSKPIHKNQLFQILQKNLSV